MTIKTNDLITILVNAKADSKPMSFAPTLAILGVLSCVITFTITKNLRPEFLTFDFPIGFFVKTFLLFGLTLTAYFYLKEMSKPDSHIKSKLLLFVFPVILSALCIFEWMTVKHISDITNLFFLPNFKSCLIYVTSYGLLGMAILTIIMKDYAPASEKTTGIMIGFAAACTGALGYSFNCPIDSPTFIAVAYGLPVFSLSLIARLIVPKHISW